MFYSTQKTTFISKSSLAKFDNQMNVTVKLDENSVCETTVLKGEKWMRSSIIHKPIRCLLIPDIRPWIRRICLWFKKISLTNSLWEVKYQVYKRNTWEAAILDRHCLTRLLSNIWELKNNIIWLIAVLLGDVNWIMWSLSTLWIYVQAWHIIIKVSCSTPLWMENTLQCRPDAKCKRARFHPTR